MVIQQYGARISRAAWGSLDMSFETRLFLSKVGLAVVLAIAFAIVLAYKRRADWWPKTKKLMSEKAIPRDDDGLFDFGIILKWLLILFFVYMGVWLVLRVFFGIDLTYDILGYDPLIGADEYGR